ncbi:hypothetical protein AWZ03_004696 [Drosophila navojoa]|uniref:Uncharacterized protein n=1 Tax=Drosophila navojoa TaxID=7232 RepID=A0A484BJ20_DRONA|nr:probable mitochondrial import receptor subunit tom70 [Drosophila navojoa]TDG48793.1 hypothetical protein AWZ03_004696 [Drosophila navojoa]
MSTLVHAELEENFLSRGSLVDDLLKFLTEVAKSNQMDAGKKEKEAKVDIDYSAGVTEDNFSVMTRISTGKREYTKKESINKKMIRRSVIPGNLDQMTFMRQIGLSYEARAKARDERIRVANNFRRLGNAEYRKMNFDKAIEYYTKAIEYISDSIVLYVNRSLCFAKKRAFKRALMDLDYVILNLDERCLRAWLIRAGTCKRMNDERGYETAVDNARRLNQSQGKYIDYFLEKVRSDF